jgi:surface protein
MNSENINKITIIYDFNKQKEIKIDEEYAEEIKKELGETISRKKLFGEKFVINNKQMCKMLINNEKRDICSYIENYQNYIIKDRLEIKLIGIENIIDSSYMFSGCVSLISLPDLSKWDTHNVSDMSFMFASKRIFIFKKDDTTNSNVIEFTYIYKLFEGFSLLKSLPDISKWDT